MCSQNQLSIGCFSEKKLIFYDSTSPIFAKLASVRTGWNLKINPFSFKKWPIPMQAMSMVLRQSKKIQVRVSFMSDFLWTFEIVSVYDVDIELSLNRKVISSILQQKSQNCKSGHSICTFLFSDMVL